ncbi:NlpC/P60 family protein [Streptomyces sp. ASQP_92]|uniref:C40 family peptidase n=1 Tax=Streptomyces sp. ASQP_92 TaxID=2979116 RepID=UPI0021BEBE48|nr:C40 family peptidase [Streptomyces sp. ASQP_92]MCT9089371.1 NlpC/P60 family protein [Streptomyces sp. ASQP_92]
MAAHRKPKQHPLGGPAARTAATLALASAATATLFEGSGHAEPKLTPAQVKAKVDQLYHDAEVATEAYDGTKEKADATERSLSELRDEAARRTERLNTARNALGSLAAAQYRSGGVAPELQLILSSDPKRYLDDAAFAERAGDRTATTVAGVRRQLAELDRLHARAEGKLTQLRGQQSTLRKQKSDIQSKITSAEALLAQLTAPERDSYEKAETAGANQPAGAASADRARAARSADAPRTPLAAVPGSRAAAAVAFAYSALGKPYVWGATGPSSFDCSGLTQAAWRSAGVQLPRTTYTQINVGSRVPRSQLAPGDLVFFYSGISHVGLYIGGGQMIHAPHPGAPVRIAPIDQMPFAGAARPA